MPKGAKILSIQMQGENCCMWVLCNEKASKERRRIAIYGTGHPIPNNHLGIFIDTFQVRNGQLVFHAFEIAI